MSLTLRPYQARDKAALYAAIRDIEGARNAASGEKARILLAQATGAGKSRLAESLIRDVISRRPCAFLVDRIDLIAQMAAHVADLKPSLIGSDYTPDPGAKLQIGTWQTAFDLLWWPDFLARDPVVIIDEAHATSWAAPVRALIERHTHTILGLTATPERSDRGEGMSELYQRCVSGAPPADLIADGWLSPGRPFVLDAPAGGDLTAPAAMEAAYTGWETHARGLPTICFAQHRRHASAIADLWTSRGWRVAVVLGDTKDRAPIWLAFASGALDIVVGVDVFTKGSDLPRIRCILDCQRTASRPRHVQKLGRGTRLDRPCEACGQHVRVGTAECHSCGHISSSAWQNLGACGGLGWKTDFMYLDQPGNTAAAGDWGRIEWVDSYQLDEPTKPRENNSTVARVCPFCAALLHPSIATCPECGIAIPRLTLDPASGVFIELTDQGSRAAEMVKIAAERGHKPGWVVGCWVELEKIKRKGAAPSEREKERWITDVVAAGCRLPPTVRKEWRRKLEAKGTGRVWLAGRMRL